jgi:hypothetical protein
MRTLIWATAVACLAASAANATFTVSLESGLPGAQDSTSGFDAVGIERFDGQAAGANQIFSSSFGGSLFTGTYTGVQVLAADQYGGAGGGGQYAVTFNEAGYSLDLSTSLPGGVSYFGFWLSALDGGNQVSFYQGGNLLFTFTAALARDFINGLPNASSYYCNPTSNFANQNCGEPYAFLNFYARGTTSFERIVFAQVPAGGGYESDNHTVGRWNRISGTVINVPGSTVPEPALWALLVTGFGFTGSALRRRRQVVAA